MVSEGENEVQIAKNIDEDNTLDCFIISRTNWIAGCKNRLHPTNKWTHSEIVEGLVLRKKIGSNNYDHIREKNLSCLPSLATLRERIAHFNVNPGMLYSSLGLVKKHLEKETREEKRLVVISYDEVAVDRDISFDQRTETPLKSSSKLQVVFSLFFSMHARGYNH